MSQLVSHAYSGLSNFLISEKKNLSIHIPMESFVKQCLVMVAILDSWSINNNENVVKGPFNDYWWSIWVHFNV
jgi:hypothetical protein